LPVDDFLELLVEAAERRREERAYQQWLALLPWMKEHQTFEEFYQKIKPVAPLSRRSREEIMAEADRIRKAAERKRRRTSRGDL